MIDGSGHLASSRKDDAEVPDYECSTLVIVDEIKVDWENPLINVFKTNLTLFLILLFIPVL